MASDKQARNDNYEEATRKKRGGKIERNEERKRECSCIYPLTVACAFAFCAAA